MLEYGYTFYDHTHSTAQAAELYPHTKPSPTPYFCFFASVPRAIFAILLSHTRLSE